MHRLIYLSVFLLLHLNMFSQFEVEWQTNFGGRGDDEVIELINTKDGGYLSCGHTWSDDIDQSNVSGERDVLISKFSEEGRLIWNRRFGGSGFDSAIKCIEISEGFVFLGRTRSNDKDISHNHGSFDFWVVKITIEGELEWEETYGGQELDLAHDIIHTNDGGFAIIGTTSSIQPQFLGQEVLVVKISSSGKEEWHRNYGGTQNDTGIMIHQENDDSFIIAGTTFSDELAFLRSESDYFIAKLSGSGEFIWQKNFGGGPGTNTLLKAQKTNAGLMLMGTHGGNDIWLIHTDISARLIWQKSIGGSGDELANAFVEIEDDGFLFVGETNSTNQIIPNNDPAGDMLIFKLDLSGKLIWIENFGSNKYDSFKSIVADPSGGYVVVGDTRSNGSNFLLNFGGLDSWIMKIGLLEENETNVQASNVSLYPNPTTKTIYINVAEENLDTKYYIQDMIGQTIISGHLKEERESIDVNSLPAGTYLYRTDTEDNIPYRFVKL